MDDVEDFSTITEAKSAQICRICSKICDKGFNLSEQILIMGHKMALREIVMKCADVQVKIFFRVLAK